MKWLSKAIPPWAWILVVAALAQSVVVLANRDVYSKSEVDVRIESLEKQLDRLVEDVQWLVRDRGGTPSAKE